jgi:hypothetical protein
MNLLINKPPLNLMGNFTPTGSASRSSQKTKRLSSKEISQLAYLYFSLGSLKATTEESFYKANHKEEVELNKYYQQKSNDLKKDILLIFEKTVRSNNARKLHDDDYKKLTQRKNKLLNAFVRASRSTDDVIIELVALYVLIIVFREKQKKDAKITILEDIISKEDLYKILNDTVDVFSQLVDMDSRVVEYEIASKIAMEL